MTRRTPLPIDAALPAILEAVRSSPSVVLSAAPGAGKTTRVPPALLGIAAGEVLVLEPRRIAARLAAQQVASEMGETLGQTVGYTVRLDRAGGEHTRLRFVTEGVLTRRFVDDPELRGVSLVVLDEFHERHLETDLALALLLRLQQTARPDLKLLVMSATLDTERLRAFLGGCPTLHCEGRAFPLEIEHRPYTAQPLEERVAQAVADVAPRTSGDLLIFLPGSAEIRRSLNAAAALLPRFDLELLPLYGSLSPAEQDRAVAPGARRKAIFATNVAESSITIPGVRVVIDSGLARIATASPWTGLPSLAVGRVSQASLQQRAGRAGRTGPGLAVRLFPEEDARLRPAFETPEILRADLTQMLLTLRAAGISKVDQLPWLDAPPVAAVNAASNLLDRLHASGEDAHRLARLPLPPRLGRVLLHAKKHGVAHSATVAVTLLSERKADGDILAAVDHPPTDPRFRQAVSQLDALLRTPRQPHQDDDQLLQALLAGFPDRVARVRQGRQVWMCGGFGAELARDAPGADFLLALDADDRNDKPLPLVRAFAKIEPEWLIDLFPDHVHETVTLEWNRGAERIEQVDAMLYDQLVLSESRHRPTDLAAAAGMLAARALEAGMPRFVDANAFHNLLERVAFAGLPPPDLDGILRELAAGLASFAELEQSTRQNLLPLLEQSAGGRLDRLAPATLRLAGGRNVRIHYEHGKPPWIESRLQDFFGMRDTPRIGPQQAPVVLHLLAPNRRAVQTTTDLAGFWARLYPSVRRELMRRYPRHLWPENPLV